MAINIRIDVDDADVDIAIAKLQQALTLQGMLTGGGEFTGALRRRKIEQDLKGFGNFMRQVDAMDASLLERFGTTDLPSINREMRIILGQVPGMREAMQILFTIKRLQRGVGKTLESGAMLPLTLSLLATAILLFQQAKRYFDGIERDKRERETLIRRYRGFSHEEYLAEMERWKLYSRSIPP